MTDEQADELMRAQIAELRAAFDAFDRDGNGLLDVEELSDALRVVGQEATREEVLKLIASVDGDGDGVIDFSEFVHLIEPRPTGLDEDADLREAFAVLDTDGDGFLSAEELRHAVANASDIALSEVKAILGAADRDGDGRISFEEFRAMLTS